MHAQVQDKYLEGRVTEREPLIQQPLNLPLSICNAILREHHQQFRKFLNVHAIGPLLNQHNLLSAMDQSVLTDPRYTVENKVDTLLDVLCKCRQENYISLLVLCLRQSAEEAGEAHTELADSIEKHYLEELRKYYNAVNISRSFFKSHVGKILVFIATATCVTFAILIAIYAGSLSGSVSKSVSFQVEGKGTIPLDLLLEPLKWLSTIEISFEKTGEDRYDDDNDLTCSGDAKVVQGKSCNKLTQVENKNVTKPLDVCFILAHPGSHFNVTIPNASDQHNYHVWITRSLEEYKNFYNQLCLDYHCPPPLIPRPMTCDDFKESCFKTIDNINKNITYTVQSTSFYCYLLTDTQDYIYEAPFEDGIQFSYKLVKYNSTIIINNTSSTFIPIEMKKPARVNINPLFKFHNEICPLVYFDCKCTMTTKCLQLVINRKPRMDSLILMIIGAVILLFAIIISLLIFFFSYKKRKHYYG